MNKEGCSIGRRVVIKKENYYCALAGEINSEVFNHNHGPSESRMYCGVMLDDGTEQYFYLDELYPLNDHE